VKLKIPRHAEPTRSGASKHALAEQLASHDLARDKPPPAGVKAMAMILPASQFYFWYFATPTLLAPDEDRSA